MTLSQHTTGVPLGKPQGDRTGGVILHASGVDVINTLALPVVAIVLRLDVYDPSGEIRSHLENRGYISTPLRHTLSVWRPATDTASTMQ